MYKSYTPLKPREPYIFAIAKIITSEILVNNFSTPCFKKILLYSIFLYGIKSCWIISENLLFEVYLGVINRSYGFSSSRINCIKKCSMLKWCVLISFSKIIWVRLTHYRRICANPAKSATKPESGSRNFFFEHTYNSWFFLLSVVYTRGIRGWTGSIEWFTLSRTTSYFLRKCQKKPFSSNLSHLS